MQENPCLEINPYYKCYTPNCYERVVSGNFCWECTEERYKDEEGGEYRIVFPDGTEHCLHYEEMVEIFHNFRTKKDIEHLSGNEYFVSAMKKAMKIFSELPITNY